MIGGLVEPGTLQCVILISQRKVAADQRCRGKMVSAKEQRPRARETAERDDSADFRQAPGGSPNPVETRARGGGPPVHGLFCDLPRGAAYMCIYKDNASVPCTHGTRDSKA